MSVYVGVRARMFVCQGRFLFVSLCRSLVVSAQSRNSALPEVVNSEKIKGHRM